LEDVVPAGMTYVPGSIQITSGANSGPKTDPAGDDQGEYLAAAHTVRVRLGSGANATQGGTMAIGGTATVGFRATVDPGVTGPVDNIASIHASGQNGAPTTTFFSGAGTPTTVVVDECDGPGECAPPTPVCLIDPGGGPNLCVGCTSDADCSGA